MNEEQKNCIDAIKELTSSYEKIVRDLDRFVEIAECTGLMVEFEPQAPHFFN